MYPSAHGAVALQHQHEYPEVELLAHQQQRAVDVAARHGTARFAHLRRMLHKSTERRASRTAASASGCMTMSLLPPLLVGLQITALSSASASDALCCSASARNGRGSEVRAQTCSSCSRSSGSRNVGGITAEAPASKPQRRMFRRSYTLHCAT
jgi:hypothetical protein